MASLVIFLSDLTAKGKETMLKEFGIILITNKNIKAKYNKPVSSGFLVRVAVSKVERDIRKKGDEIVEG